MLQTIRARMVVSCLFIWVDYFVCSWQ